MINIQKIIGTSLLLIITTTCFGQSQQTKFYKDERLKKEVSADKAKISKTVIQNTDGTETTEIWDIQNNKMISRITHWNTEPSGSHTQDDFDDSFELKYDEKYCKDSIAGIKNYFEDNNSLHYIAPEINGYRTFNSFFVNNFRYPSFARENKIMGKVWLAFTITDKGVIEDIVVVKGVHVSLDREAVRTMRKLKLNTPPLINGQARTICVTMPVSFTIQ